MAEKKNAPEAALENSGKVESKFPKEQLLASERFWERRDILEALLENGELYTVKAVEEKIESYMKGKVK